MTKALQSPPGYAALLKDIKERVRTAQMRATLAVNRELILLYWSIGRDILDRQQAEGWGTKVIDRLVKDLGHEFPGVECFTSFWGLVSSWGSTRPKPQGPFAF